MMAPAPGLDVFPRPAQAMSSIYALNEDILLAIFSYIHGADALNAALVSRGLYPFAIPRVASRAKSITSEELQRLCDYMLLPGHGHGPHARVRANYLHILSVNAAMTSTYDWKFDVQGWTSDAEIAQQMAILHRFSCLLSHAEALRELRLTGIPWSSVWMGSYISKVGTAMSALNSLRILDCSGVTDELVSSLPPLQTLGCLHLAYVDERRVYHSDTGWTWTDVPSTLSSLFHALSGFPRIHELVLENFRPVEIEQYFYEEVSPEPDWLLQRFPSIQDLTLRHCSPATTLFVSLCPRLSCLSIGLLPQTSGRPARSLATTALPLCPPLRHLFISPVDLRFVVQRLSTVQRLYCTDAYSDSRYGAIPLNGFAQALSALSPTRVLRSFGLRQERQPEAQAFWEGLRTTQPGVRSMDLVVGAIVDEGTWISLFRRMAKALPRLPFLVALRFIVDLSFCKCLTLYTHRHCRLEPGESWLRAQTEGVGVLVQHAFRYIPTLEVVAIARGPAVVSHTPPYLMEYMNVHDPYVYYPPPDYVLKQIYTKGDAEVQQTYQFTWFCRGRGANHLIKVPNAVGQQICDLMENGDKTPAAELVDQLLPPSRSS
ncbi:hypothetical protein BN946_scf184939.g5 [Trametes cinnabarina]|uniref:F-box domain-containing protein n=1 Tax=Pycnoporus cinnabarinus TaxID=5643 RepID=A0A060SC36_PYCCI|nr:hypothetical protein BN946_scf184939.g5 [Trametes cinnabarina]